MTQDTGWERDLEEARTRLAALDAAQLTEQARASVAEWRSVASFSSFFLPLPLVAQDVPSLHGRWGQADEKPEAGRFDALGLDAAGRPVLHLLDPGSEFERTNHLWLWDTDGSFLEVELMGSGPHVRRARVADGRLSHLATASAHGSVAVVALEWDDGIAIRASIASRWQDGSGLDRIVTADVREGEVWALRSGSVESSGPIAAGLARAASLSADRLVWDGRLLRPEPWPGRSAAEAFVEPLAVALDDALRRAARDSGIDDAFLLQVFNGGSGVGEAAFPPSGLLAGTRWREGMRRASATDGEALNYLHRGVEAGDVARLELVEHLDAEALRACRVLSTSLGLGAAWDVNRAAAAIADELGDHLARLLNGAPFDGAVDPFLALVEAGDPYGEIRDRATERAREATGHAHMARFSESVTSLVSGGAGARAEPNRSADAEALTDRAALEALIAGTPLAEHAHRLAHDVAADGLFLDPAPGTAPPPRSRVGGPALLPAGADWPTTTNGVPLTFLAAIDLTELPASDVTDALPRDGWLLFFAGLDFDLDDDDMLMDVAENTPGAPARILRCADVVDAEPPEQLHEAAFGVLGDKRVVFRRALTLPDGYDAAGQLGLGVYEQEAYEQLTMRLHVATAPDRTWEEGWHWIGGHVTGVQGHTPDENTVLLLHLSGDDDIDFQYADAGAIQFRIPKDALAAGDWSRAYAEGDSC